MHQSVIDNFVRVSTPLEGCVEHFYLDIKGLVTIGIGCLVDPVQLAYLLPMVHKTDNSEANANDIIYDWRAVKLNTQLARQGAKAADKITKLKLLPNEITILASKKLIDNEHFIRNHYFLNFDEYPADAQLAIMLMAWAVGAGFPTIFKKLTTHIKSCDWNSCAEECYINSKNNPGLVPRNKLVRKLFLSAAYITHEQLNPENLYGLQELPTV